MSLGQTLSGFWHSIQADLFPWLEEEFGPLGGRYRRFVTVLEFARVESFLPHFRSLPGRPVEDRAALARAFIAKAVFDIPTTRALIERLQVDRTLRRLCGWTYAGEIPSEATFSRAFAEFSASALPARLHEALIEKTLGDHLVGHVSRDATAIEARERPAPKPRAEKPKRKRGRPRKGEERPRELRRVERQLKMTLPQMLDDLPKACAVGTKRNAKGHTTSWIGYKLHIDAADGGIPLSCILTSASLHDSQVAIPLATMTAERVTNLYDLMDSAYDVPEIGWHSYLLGHVPIIDINPRDKDYKEELAREAGAQSRIGYVHPADERYDERSNVERVNAGLKDNCGGRHVRVRGHAKVHCHLMFAILVLTVDQLMRLLT